MVQNLVDSRRLRRAKSITKKNVLEFAIVKENPIIAYCLIQGSARDPYIVIIDLEEKIVSHWCPDFIKNRSSWCKHLGKLLLQLPSNAINNISAQKSRLQYKKKKNEQTKALEAIKNKLVLAQSEGAKSTPAQEAITLDDQIAAVCRLMEENASIPAQLDALVKRITETLDATEQGLKLYLLRNILKCIPRNIRADFFKITGNLFSKYVEDALDDFLSNFWIRSTIVRMEQAFLLSRIAHNIKHDSSIAGLDFPKDLTREEKMDGCIVLKMLFRYGDAMKKIPENLRFQDDDLNHRLHRLAKKIEITGTALPEVKGWIEHELEMSVRLLHSFDFGDDVLVYIMKSAGKRPRMDLKTGYRRNYSYLNTKQINSDPLLAYAFDHILESQREYITQDELNIHRTFFNWLKGSNVKTSWIERPRQRKPLSTMKLDGFIVQWDINVKSLFDEFLQAYDGNTRLVLDATSTILPKVQPFDYTLCHEETLNRPDWTTVCKPKAILTPDQVIKLVKRGTRIISNLLPWDIFFNYFSVGFHSGGELEIAIKKCKSMGFAYGAPALQSELEALRSTGQSGLNEEKYSEYHKTLKGSTGRLNVSTRKICREILLAEGRQLNMLIKHVGSREDDRLRLLLKAGMGEGELHQFRKNLSKKIIQSILNKGISKQKLDIIIKEDLGLYNNMKVAFISELREQYKKIQKLASGKRIRVSTLMRNPLGALIAREADLASLNATYLSEEDADVFGEKVDNVKGYFTRN